MLLAKAAARLEDVPRPNGCDQVPALTESIECEHYTLLAAGISARG